MRKLLLVLILTFTYFQAVFADALSDAVKADLEKLLTFALTPISVQMAQHMGYITGSGNVAPMDTSGDLHMKFGLGFGFNTTDVYARFKKGEDVFKSDSTDVMVRYFNALSKAVALVPFPYDEAYCKIGIPGRKMDAGLRIGFIPPINLKNEDTIVSFSQFHIGAEGRTMIYEYGIFKVDGRASIDYDGGQVGFSYDGKDQAYTNGTPVGTNVYSIDLKYQWAGVSLGGKIMAGISIPYIGGLFIGMGVNINLGGVKTSAKINDTFTPLIGPAAVFPEISAAPVKGYNLLDVRLITGIQIFFASMAFEYGILNKDLAWVFLPISLAF